MLNITILVVPSQPNQITLFTSAASQHGSAFRLMLILLEPWEQGRIRLDLRRLIGIPLRVSGAHGKKTKTDGFLKRGFLTDKGLFAIGIKEGPAMNQGEVRECSWKWTKVECYARLLRWYLPESHGEFTLRAWGDVSRAGPRQSERNVVLVECSVNLIYGCQSLNCTNTSSISRGGRFLFSFLC